MIFFRFSFFLSKSIPEDNFCFFSWFSFLSFQFSSSSSSSSLVLWTKILDWSFIVGFCLLALFFFSWNSLILFDVRINSILLGIWCFFFVFVFDSIWFLFFSFINLHIHQFNRLNSESKNCGCQNYHNNKNSSSNYNNWKLRILGFFNSLCSFRTE